jgi:catechol 2,3-dioxygenase-like lactoylglutathione lyase family enzyme
MTGFGQAITFLYAADPNASRRFYAETLGLRLVLDQGICAIFAVAAGAFLGVCRARGPREPGDPRREGGVVCSFVTDDVEAWHAKLVAAGVAVDGPPVLHAAYGVTGFFFRDPAGYLLEVQRFEGEGWPR